MEKKKKGKTVNKKMVLILAIVVLLVVIFGITKFIASNNWKNAKKVEDIEIKESDSKEIKIEKIQAKIRILNEQIGELEEKRKVESEKMNTLYEEQVEAMREYQIESATEE